MENVEYIYTNKRELLALIVRNQFSKDGIKFFTDNKLSQQLAYMKRPSGYAIVPHTHKPVLRDVNFTLETLFIKRGRIKVTFYEKTGQYVTDRELFEKDVILLISGGHGFSFLEESEIVEVKQGPYAEDQDKEYL